MKQNWSGGCWRDHLAFNDIYNHYSGPLFVNVLKMVKDEESAHEIIQEIFTRLWQKKESIRPETHFAGYFYRMSQNLVFDFYRRLKQQDTLRSHFRTLATAFYSHIEEQISHGIYPP